MFGLVPNNKLCGTIIEYPAILRTTPLLNQAKYVK